MNAGCRVCKYCVSMGTYLCCYLNREIRKPSYYCKNFVWREDNKVLTKIYVAVDRKKLP